MKKLTIEEKTKACDEAIYNNYKSFNELIERLESVKDAIKKQNYGIAMDILCNPYPEFQITTSTELAESEDKQIMKEIAEFIYNSAFKPKDIKKKEKWLTWFEKQGEQKCVIDEGKSEIDYCFTKMMNGEKVSPTWSEEDEKRTANILSVLSVQVCWDGATGKKMNPYQKEIDWLKSLKVRIGRV